MSVSLSDLLLVDSSHLSLAVLETTESKVAPEQQDVQAVPRGVFGSLPAWNAPAWAPVHGISALEDFGRHVETDSIRLLATWRSLGHGYAALASEDFVEASDFVTPLDEVWWPLIQLMRLMQITWKNATKGAPRVIEKLGKMQRLVSQGSHYISSTDRMLETFQKFPELGNPDTTLVLQMRGDIVRYVTQFRYLWEQLSAFDRLSARWVVLAKRSWLRAVPEDPQALQEIGKCIFFWIVEFEKERKALGLHRDTICAAFGLDSSAVEESWYWFGNPSTAYLKPGVAG